MGYVSGLQNRQIVRNGGRPARAGAQKAGGFKDPAALGEQQLEKALERASPFEAEELQHVFSPKGVEPLLEVGLRQLFGEEKRRQPAPEQPVIEIGTPEIDEVGGAQGGEPDLLLPPCQGVAKAAGGAERRGGARQDPLEREVVGRAVEQLAAP